jgi:hypothetical protein
MLTIQQLGWSVGQPQEPQQLGVAEAVEAA